MVSEQKEIGGDLWFYLPSSRAGQNCFPQLGRGWGSFAGRLQAEIIHKLEDEFIEINVKIKRKKC